MPANPYGLLLQQVRRLVGEEADTDTALLGRFVKDRDQAAFADLVRRHGSQVFGLCRRWLGHEQDAEDVFQATFLVLARKAESIRNGQALPSFLHGVALRLARKARTETARRRQPLSDRPPLEQANPLDHLRDCELRQGLDEELSRLPERYRGPLLLCHLQGQTQDEAARALGWSKGTLRRRLARGRDLLKARLLGRGLTPASGLGISLLADSTAAPASAPLVDTTVKAAFMPEAISGPVAALTEIGVRILTPAKLRTTLTLLLATSVLALAGGLAAYQSRVPPHTPVPQPEFPSRPTPLASPGNQPLPEGAVAMLGTRHGRSQGMVRSLAFTPDSKTLVSCGWEGCIRLWDSETGRLLRKLSREPIYHMDGLSLANDGRTLATRTESKPGITWTADVWDLVTGKTTFSLRSQSLLGQVALSPDGKTLACLEFPEGKEAGISLHDLSSSRRLNPIRDTGLTRGGYSESDHERFLQFSPDGRLLALGARNDAYPISGNSAPPLEGFLVQVWDAHTGKSLCVLSGAQGASSCLAFAPDSKSLITGNSDGAVRLWELPTGKQRQVLQMPEGPIMSVAVAADGKTVAAASRGKKPLLLAWDLASGREVFRRLQQVGRLALSADGRRLALVDECNVIRLLDAQTGQALKTPPGHTSLVSSLLFSADGKELASASYDGQVYRWDLATAQPNAEYPTGSLGKRWLAYAPDGALLTADRATPDELRVWELGTGKVRRRLEEKGFPDYQLSPDGSLAMLSSHGMNLSTPARPAGGRLWDLTTGKPWPTMPELHSEWGIYMFSPNGQRLASPIDLTVWDLATGWTLPRPDRLLKAVSGQTMVYAQMALSADGTLLAFRQQSATAAGIPFAGRHQQTGPLRLWDTVAGKDRWQLTLREENEPLGPLVFSPDSQLLAGAGFRSDRTVRVWDVASGKELRRFAGHEGAVQTLAFSPDGQRLASGSEDTTILIWDLAEMAVASRK